MKPQPLLHHVQLHAVQLLLATEAAEVLRDAFHQHCLLEKVADEPSALLHHVQLHAVQLLLGTEAAEVLRDAFHQHHCLLEPGWSCKGALGKVSFCG